MYRLNGSAMQSIELQNVETHYLTFMKNKFNLMVYVEKEEDFAELFTILKKYCILSNFSSTYEILEFLGKGHFAEVYSVVNISNKKKFAAKLIETECESFKNNSVGNII